MKESSSNFVSSNNANQGGNQLIAAVYGDPGDDGGSRTNGKGNTFRGGPQSQRDQDMKRYPKEFKNWYHKNTKDYKLPGQPDPDLAEPYQDWLDLGKPTVNKITTGLTWGLIGWGAYEGIKWGAAIILAPETGGGSLVGAGVLP